MILDFSEYSIAVKMRLCSDCDLRWFRRQPQFKRNRPLFQQDNFHRADLACLDFSQSVSSSSISALVAIETHGFAVKIWDVNSFNTRSIFVAKHKSNLKEIIVEFSEFDVDKPIASKEDVAETNPHRHELALLDGILFDDLESGRAVGFKDVRDDEFWVRGHFPEKAIMPGVVICECAAQLCAYYAKRSGLLEDCIIGLGGLDEIRFRGPVVPGDKLITMLQKTKGRKNMLIVGQFQCYVRQELVVEGIIRGVALPKPE